MLKRIKKLARSFLLVLLLIILVTGIKSVSNRRDWVDVSTTVPVTAPIYSPGDYAIADPYDVQGEWYKAQLHMHTDHSIDGSWSESQALDAYAGSGYDFLAISDHDSITIAAETPDNLVLIPAEENTISFPVWPLGQHAVYLFINEHVRNGSAGERFEQARSQGALVSIAHPNWAGNLGLGRWEMGHLLAAPQFSLMEVFNPYSDSRLDTATWHDTIARRGEDSPVWAIAVDDAHGPEFLNKGWTMVKTDEKTPEGLKEALERGSIYPSTGVIAEFSVNHGAIVVTTDQISTIEYINRSGNIVYSIKDTSQAEYIPSGHEGFVRVEVTGARSGGRAWSQPFWLKESR